MTTTHKNYRIWEDSYEDMRKGELDHLGYTSLYSFDDLWNDDALVVKYHQNEDEYNDAPTQVMNIRKEYR